VSIVDTIRSLSVPNKYRYIVLRSPGQSRLAAILKKAF